VRGLGPITKRGSSGRHRRRSPRFPKFSGVAGNRTLRPPPPKTSTISVGWGCMCSELRAFWLRRSSSGGTPSRLESTKISLRFGEILEKLQFWRWRRELGQGSSDRIPRTATNRAVGGLSGYCRGVSGPSSRTPSAGKENMMNIIATNIRQHRERLGWTQEHLAEAAQINVRTLQRAESGRGVSAESLTALAGLSWGPRRGLGHAQS